MNNYLYRWFGRPMRQGVALKSLLKTSLMAITMLVSLSTLAQDKTVSGKVTDGSDNSGLPGVSVTVVGVNKGTQTSGDGTYKITVPANATLVFSFVGFAKQSITVGNKSVIDVALISDNKALEEVVVIGYGESKKKDVTGGITTLGSKDFNQGVIASPEQLLQGRMAGVQMTPSSGEPGAGVNIRIRGTSSVRAGNGPLFVIDGVPVSGDATSDGGQDIGSGSSSARNPLNFLNPQDIENMTVLKDASAAAIYGSRGSNGVVLITTKKGKSGQQMFNFSATASVSSILKKYDLVSAANYPAAVTRSGNDGAAVNYGGSTDWQDQIFRTSVSQNYNMNFGGGNDNTRYFMSLGYSDQQGTVKTSGLQRVTARINASHELFDKKLKLELQLTTSGISDQFAPISNNAGYQGSLLGAALQANPTYPVFDSQGRYFNVQGYNTDGTPKNGDFRNPVQMLANLRDNAETSRTLGNISASYSIIDGLVYKLNFGIDNSTSERTSRLDPNTIGYSNRVGFLDVTKGLNTVQNRTGGNRLIEHTLSYGKTLGNDRLDAVAGFSYQKFMNKGHYVQSGYLLDNGATDNIGGVNNKDNKAFYGFSDNTPSELQSYFGRANYNIANKYILTATVRVDGSSKFGTNNKYGTFPSVGAAWKLSNENFIPKDVFTDLKLRLNYGITGNQEFPANLTQATRNYDPNNGTSNADNAANDNLKWEQTTTSGVGIDFAILKGRLSGTIDYFNKATTNLIFRGPNPDPVSPSPFLWSNLDATVTNKGVELGLNYAAIQGKMLTWNVAYNMTFLSNNVDKLAGSFIPTAEVNGRGLSGAFAERIQQGYPLFAFFVPKFNGFDEKGYAIYPDGDKPIYGGSPIPTFNFGLTNSFTYGNFDLSVFINGATGFYVYNNTANAIFYKAALNIGGNVTNEVANSNEYNYNAGSVSTRFLEKGDFVRISNVNIGYTFNLPNSKSIKSLRLNLTGQNLALFTSYSGVDPEVNTNKSLNGIPSLGMDYTSYPSARTFSIGLNAGF